MTEIRPIEDNRIYNTYGMRLRGYAPSCQPMHGLCVVSDEGEVNGRYYHNLLTYDRELTKAETSAYELDHIYQFSTERKDYKYDNFPGYGKVVGAVMGIYVMIYLVAQAVFAIGGL